MIEKFGVRGVQVEEIYDLERIYEQLGHGAVHGLIFLFKWDPALMDSRKAEDPEQCPVFFASQVVTNACATQAILAILLNSETIELGPDLTDFKSFASSFPPELKGTMIGDHPLIRTAHNSFARAEPLISDEKKATKDDDVYHFISYLHIAGSLYELDGLKQGPINHGPADADSWLERVRPIIQDRIDRYSAKEIHFNLLALVQNRKEMCLREIDTLATDKQRLLSQIAGLSGGDAQLPELNARVLQIDDRVPVLKGIIANEDDKFKMWREENVRRKHNYIPFLINLLQILASKNQLMPLLSSAQATAQANAQANAQSKTDSS